MSNEGPDDLGERIAEAQAKRAKRERKTQARQDQNDGSVSAGAYALRYGAEFGAAVFVGGFLGYWFDHFAGTKPWGLLILGTFGVATGIRSIYRAYLELDAQAKEYTERLNASDNGKTDG